VKKWPGLLPAEAAPILVIGTKAGLRLIHQMRDIACNIEDDQDPIYCSDNIRPELLTGTT
jgi:FAD:protein FMN transferase